MTALVFSCYLTWLISRLASIVSPLITFRFLVNLVLVNLVIFPQILLQKCDLMGEKCPYEAILVGI